MASRREPRDIGRLNRTVRQRRRIRVCSYLPDLLGLMTFAAWRLSSTALGPECCGRVVSVGGVCRPIAVGSFGQEANPGDLGFGVGDVAGQVVVAGV